MIDFRPANIFRTLMPYIRKPKKIDTDKDTDERAVRTALSPGRLLTAPLVKAVALRAFFVLLGFAAGNMRLPFDAYPAGLALISALPGYVIYAYAGAALSLLTVPSFRVVYLLMYTGCLAVRLGYERSKPGAALPLGASGDTLHLLLSGASAMVAGTVMLLSDGVNTTSVVRILMLTLPALLLAFILTGLRVGEEAPPAEVSMAAAAFIIIYSIQSVSLISLTPAVILSAAATLCVSRVLGPAKGALIGVACAIATGKSFVVGGIALMGLASGLFFTVSDALAVTAGAVCAIAYVATATSLGSAQAVVPDILFGCVLFLPVRLLGDKLKLLRQPEKPAAEKGGTTYMPARGVIATSLPSRRLDNLSAAFGELNEVFADLSERFRRPSVATVKAELQTALERVCESCPMREDCASREFVASQATAFECADYLSERGRLTPTGLPPRIEMRCAMPDELCKQVNTAYNLLLANTLKLDKTQLLAKWYSLIGKLLKNASRDGHDDINFCREQSEHIFTALDQAELPCQNVVVMGSRVKSVYLFGISPAMKELPADQVRELMQQILGCPLSEPEYSEEDGSSNLQFVSVARIQVERAYSSTARGAENGDAVNGDAVVFFDSPSDFYSYALISDGMGSGRQAALASRLACLLTEKLLSAGGKKEMTIELLNTVLLSTGEECFTTVDLLEIDLISQEASFIKAGAAPAFVVRRGSIFKIQSASVPVGIVNSLNAEITSFKFEKGDVAVMLSDGVLSTYEEGVWLLELLEREGGTRSVQDLATVICTQARARSSRRDDISCAVVAIR